MEKAFCFWSLFNHPGLLCCQNKLSETKSDHITPCLKSFRALVVCRIKWEILCWESNSTRAQPCLLFHAGLWTVPVFYLGLSQLLLVTPPDRLVVPPTTLLVLFPFCYVSSRFFSLSASLHTHPSGSNVLGVHPLMGEKPIKVRMRQWAKALGSGQNREWGQAQGPLYLPPPTVCLRGVLVCRGCHNTVAQTGCLTQQNGNF